MLDRQTDKGKRIVYLKFSDDVIKWYKVQSIKNDVSYSEFIEQVLREKMNENKIKEEN